MNPLEHPANAVSRRSFLGLTGLGLGAMAARSLLAADLKIPAAALPARNPHFAPKAKRVIYLFQSGGPSHIDLFDYKPELEKLHGKDLPDSVRQGQRLTGMTSGQKSFPLCKGLKPFAQHGESGQWISEYLPYTSGIADKIAVIRSMHTEAINHDPGITFINTGSQFPGMPSMGSWVSYGLGSMNENLPSYVVLTSQGTGKNPGQPIFSRLWGSGFLPSSHQGVQFRSGKDPVLFLNDPAGITRSDRRAMLDDLAAFNRIRHDELGDPEIQTRISQYEMAFRMQASAPELADLSDEPDSVFELYGEDARRPGTYAYNCLLARRMAERGVRFTQLFHRGWDQHLSLPTHLAAQCNDTDQASAALITDLDRRGLLEDTLVIWGGEFGRTVYSQGKLGTGRDHHGRCFSSWVAGGGTKAGTSYGLTDDYSYNIVENPVHIRDLNATILHCLGMDHDRFTFRFQGLNQKPTGVTPAKVVEGILA
ncbi:DUF1501 domain-containing protein [Akkermansiaceae bacterium]|nr:DUF1501 domain-containing protein [Akkermansiaceae bacterium]